MYATTATSTVRDAPHGVERSNRRFASVPPRPLQPCYNELLLLGVLALVEILELLLDVRRRLLERVVACSERQRVMLSKQDPNAGNSRVAHNRGAKITDAGDG